MATSEAAFSTSRWTSMDFRQLLREERRRARDATPSKPKDVAIVKDNDAKHSKFLQQLQNSSLKTWSTRSPINVEQFRRGPIPGVYYVPNWITPEEEKAILERVYAVPDDDAIWVKLKHRRLQMWGGQVKAPFTPIVLPDWLTQISQALVDAGIFKEDKTPNHALINEYGVGDCILPHEDGPSYFPLVAIISAGAECRVTYEPHRALDGDNEEPASVVPHFSFQLERCSLLLFTGEAYTRYLHSIDNVEVGTRISLTVRHVNLR